MRCHVYRSSLKDGLYVYVAAAADGGPRALGELPEPVRRQLGRAELAMTLELDEHRRLGQEDIGEVLGNLRERGFHVQMPRDIEPDVARVAEAVTREASAGVRADGDHGKRS